MLKARFDNQLVSELFMNEVVNGFRKRRGAVDQRTDSSRWGTGAWSGRHWWLYEWPPGVADGPGPSMTSLELLPVLVRCDNFGAVGVVRRGWSGERRIMGSVLSQWRWLLEPWLILETIAFSSVGLGAVCGEDWLLELRPNDRCSGAILEAAVLTRIGTDDVLCLARHSIETQYGLDNHWHRPAPTTRQPVSPSHERKRRAPSANSESRSSGGLRSSLSAATANSTVSGAITSSA
ncbi:hypothetical protein FJT64_002119 [Amphibalanus amphitrite]|uniref:Uncharacterized protein n=1 Tax=Amphibalanus amphitrite TaxID=1232801 RepID=A0A6A4WYE7_AMPAM|nr:hypothetical protein FJT64_002119 [Amphibalanus amphitrite]